MSSVACEFSLSTAPPSDHPFPRTDLDSRFPPSTATGSEARSTEFPTAGGPVRRFKIGDMVWGAVKSHPWWPGQIFDEACALPIVRRSKVDGHVLVAFFGDSSYGWLDPSDLLPFEPHFPDLSKQVGSPNFANAVVDAVDEVNRRAALGFVCRCRIPFRPTRVPGYVTVDVPGYEPGDYSMVQIEEARKSILPSELFSIASELAVTHRRKEEVSVDRIRRKAMLLAYRRAVFEEVDQAYDEAFGRKTWQPKILNIRGDGTDRSPKKKKGRLHNLGDELQTSGDDTNLQLSDLLATSRRRQQPSTSHPAVIAVRPVVGQICGSPARSFMSPSCPDSSDAGTPELQTELRPSNVSRPEPPSELEHSSALTTPPPVTVTNLAADEVNMDNEIQIPKRPLENPKPKMKKTVKKLKRETPLPEPSLNTDTAIPPRVSEFQLSQALGDLRSLAVDVFYEDERNTPKIVNRVFGRFRSMVYWKRKPDQLPVSHVNAPTVTSIVDHPPSIAESKPALVPPKALGNAVVRRKTAKSDRLEDMSAKKQPKSAVKSAIAVARPKKQFDMGSNKDVGSAVASPEPIQRLDSGSEKDVDSSVVSLRPNQRLHSEIKEVMVSADAELKLCPELDYVKHKDVDSAMPSAKPIQPLDSGTKNDVDSTVAKLKIDQQLSLGAKKGVGPAVAELKTNQHLSSGKKKDIDSAVAKQKPKQQLDSETTVAKRNPNQQHKLGTKNNVGSAVAELKPNQQLDSGTEKEDNSFRATLLDSGKKKDVATLKPNQLLLTVTKNDVGSVVPAPQLNFASKKDEDSAVAEPKLNLQLNSGTKREVDSAGELKLNQQHDSGMKTEVGSAVAKVKPIPQPATPTYLIMKFPSNAALPKVPYLNMRLSRLGKIKESNTGVNLKTNSCRVLFKSRSDAELAFKYMESRQFFGEIKVEYSLRDFEPRPQKVSKQAEEVGSAAVHEIALPTPIGDASTRQPVELPKKAVVKEPRQPAELPPKPHVEKKEFSNVAGTTRQPAELPPKPHVEKKEFSNVAGTTRQPAEVPPKPHIEKKEFSNVAGTTRQPAELPPKPHVELPPKPHVEKKEVSNVAGTTRQPAELPPKPHVELPPKPHVEKKEVSNVAGTTRQPAELPPKPHVELPPKPHVEKKEVSNVTGSAAVRNVALGFRPTELPPKPCIKKAVSKSAATKEVRFSAGGGNSVVEPPVGRPHDPKLLTRPRPPLPPAPSCMGILGPSPVAPPPTMVGGSVDRADISHKMMSLLVKCKEVVDSVESSLGYLPYHPI